MEQYGQDGRTVVCPGREGTQKLDMKVPGIILAVTGIIALIVSLTKGPNLGLSRRTGVTIGIVLLVLGGALLIYALTAQ